MNKPTKTNRSHHLPSSFKWNKSIVNDLIDASSGRLSNFRNQEGAFNRQEAFILDCSKLHKNNVLSTNILPWVPEAYHARFPVSVKSLPLVSSAFGRTCVGLLPTKRPSPSHTRQNLWYPGCKYMQFINTFLQVHPFILLQISGLKKLNFDVRILTWNLTLNRECNKCANSC